MVQISEGVQILQCQEAHISLTISSGGGGGGDQFWGVHFCRDIAFPYVQPLKAPQPNLARCLKQLAGLHLIQPLGLPVFYLAMKWRGMDFSGPVPPW